MMPLDLFGWAPPPPSANRDLTILGRQRDGNVYQYNNRSLKRIE
jgi:hypothetical protein